MAFMPLVANFKACTIKDATENEKRLKTSMCIHEKCILSLLLKVIIPPGTFIWIIHHIISWKLCCGKNKISVFFCDEFLFQSSESNNCDSTSTKTDNLISWKLVSDWSRGVTWSDVLPSHWSRGNLMVSYPATASH